MLPLTIFEGPDCSGKSTVAYEFKKQHGEARLIHHGPYPGIQKLLPRLYVETMLPMLETGASQIWDRAWYSEPIYGGVFRHGQDRVGAANRRHLERFALRHGAVVVLCLPPYEAVKETWLKRKGEEYLEHENQLQAVYDAYVGLRDWCGLPVVLYDYTRHDKHALFRAIDQARHQVHKHSFRHLGGNYNARVVLVGDKFSDLRDEDCNWRLPFASFSAQGCSRWLTEKLDHFAIREDQLLWTNSDDDLGWLKDRHNELVVALGKEAETNLKKAGIPHTAVDHPQYWRRFNSTDPFVYPLFKLLADTLGVHSV